MRTSQITLSLMGFLFVAGPVTAAGVCDSALIISTYNSFSSDHIDWRLATLVTEKEYDEIKHDEGVNAVIYGIPVGQNYSDFQKSVREKQKSYKESYVRDQLRNIQWTGLDPNGAGAYKKCLESEVLNGRGLHLAVKSATDNDVAVIVSWNPQLNDPPSITADWKWAEKGKADLQTHIQQGTTTVVIPRPKQVHTLAINFPGASDSIVIEPTAKIPAELTVVPWVVVAEQYRTNLLASGACADFGQWASVCTPDKPDSWTITSEHFSIIGDRAGGAYAQSGYVGTPSNTKVCYQFRTQGHSEQCGSHGNTGIQNSTGVLDVTWQHH